MSKFPTQGWVDTAFYTIYWQCTYIHSYIHTHVKLYIFYHILCCCLFLCCCCFLFWSLKTIQLCAYMFKQGYFHYKFEVPLSSSSYLGTRCTGSTMWAWIGWLLQMAGCFSWINKNNKSNQIDFVKDELWPWKWKNSCSETNCSNQVSFS